MGHTHKHIVNKTKTLLSLPVPAVPLVGVLGGCASRVQEATVCFVVVVCISGIHTVHTLKSFP